MNAILKHALITAGILIAFTAVGNDLGFVRASAAAQLKVLKS